VVITKADVQGAEHESSQILEHRHRQIPMPFLSSLRRFPVGCMVGTALVLGLSATGWAADPAPQSPIRHVVVIYDENVSFDHYFATYPNAVNAAGDVPFHALPETPTVNGLSGPLLSHNPNSANPFRLDRSQAVTCDMDHAYSAEQKAYNGGLVNRFVEATAATSPGCDPKLVMGYYDGNTVTALWNYAQRYALNDNNFGTVFGPSTPGALNLFAAQTSGADQPNLPRETVQGTVIADPDPIYDDCSARKLSISNPHTLGDLLNDAGLTWGWFQGGYRPTQDAANSADGKSKCGSKSKNAAGKESLDYSAHHNPLAYFEQFKNPHHLPPSVSNMIGHTDQAMHQYDLMDFWEAVDHGDMPAVSFLKAKESEDGHAGYSGPLDEQRFLVETINRLQRSPQWSSTAIIIAYDDSDGWYDHVMPPIIRGSESDYDFLTGEKQCGLAAAGTAPGRCGYGPRLPLLVISPYARRNFVDHTLVDQTSIARFIEDNWALPRLGGEAMDRYAGSFGALFDFVSPARTDVLILNPRSGSGSSD
jgi:phospholipase C